MKIKRAELIKILEAVSPAIGKKDMQEQISGFFFTGDDIVTYNEQLCIRYPFASDFVCAVEADKFYKILKGVEEESISITIGDSSLSVVSNKTEAKLSVSLDNASIEETMKSISTTKLMWEELPEDFIKALSLCLFSVSTDVAQGVLTCIYIGDGKLFSSDNYRISMYELEGIDTSILLPLSSAKELTKFDVKEYSLADSWVHFRTADNVVFSSRVIKEEYPDCAHYFKLEGGDRLRMPKDLKEAVDAVTLFAEGEIVDKEIKVSFQEDAIFCIGESKHGWVKKKVPIQYKRKDISFNINPVFFSQILNNITSVLLTKEKALFKSGNFKHILALPLD